MAGTKLELADELMFRNWLQQNRVPFDPNSSNNDYDMRGFYQGQRQQSPHAQSEVNANDGEQHYTDYYKMPWHPTYSADSQGAGPDAPNWNKQDQLVGQDGKVLYDEKFLKILRGMQ